MRPRILFLSYCLLFLVSCRPDNAKINSQRYLRNIIGKKIEIPSDLIAISPFDSIKYNNLIYSKYKIIYFIDSSECSECNVKYMTLFNEFFNKAIKKSASLLLILNTKDYFDIKIFMNKYQIKHPCFLDFNGSFKKSNKYFKSGIYDVLLLRNDTIIFAGKSKYDDKFYSLFLDQIGK